MIEREKVADWLQDEGLEWQELEGEPGVEWHFVVSFPDPDGPPLRLVAPEEPRGLAIVRSMDVAERHRTALVELSEQEFHEFKFGLVRDLLVLEVQYQLQLESPQNLTGLNFTYIFREPPDRHTFFQRMQRVHSAGLLGVIHVRKAAGDAI